VPSEARWAHLKVQAKQPTVGQLVDDAMAGIERDNPALKGVLPRTTHALRSTSSGSASLLHKSRSSPEIGRMTWCRSAIPAQLLY